MSDDLKSLQASADKAVDALSHATTGSSAAAGGQPWNPWLILFLTFLVIGFSLWVLYLMRGMLKEGHAPSDVLRLATMPMVVAASIFLVLLGFSNEQMTPVIGLLGTMIGYVLGSATARPAAPPPIPSAPTPPTSYVSGGGG